MNNKKSQAAFMRARQLMPGGVNSPVRSFKDVGVDPVFIKNAHGTKIIDIDNNEYIDYIGSFGPLILGHSDARVVEAICTAAHRGTSYGACCEAEIELAAMITEAIPTIEKIRMVNSGTEATMSAIRLARAYTGREKIVKFEGCYHGHGDSFLIKAGSGLLTAGIPTSPGIPNSIVENTLVCTYNDIESVQKVFKQSGADIAAIIVEPVAGNMGLVLPEKEFLQGLREITAQNGSLLIFDEVITGFRLGYGGYQNIINIEPDLTTLGKIIGGGLPVGAYGGRKEIMSRIAPEGDVYQAGTLSGNPLAMAAGITTLKILRNKDIYEQIDKLNKYLCTEIGLILNSQGIKHHINRCGSIFTLFFTEKNVYNYQDVLSCDTKKYATFFQAMLANGIYFPPAQFEVGFISAAHTEEDIEKTITAVKKSIAQIR
jgi:glutamate-1-semialdehyde 2,1-aminomutase